MPSAQVAYVIAGTVHNDQFAGARISATQKGDGGTVVVYDKDGNRTVAVLYGQMARCEIRWEVAGG